MTWPKKDPPPRRAVLAEIPGLSKVNPQNIGGVLGMAEWFIYESSENLPSAPGTTVRLGALTSYLKGSCPFKKRTWYTSSLEKWQHLDVYSAPPYRSPPKMYNCSTMISKKTNILHCFASLDLMMRK